MTPMLALAVPANAQDSPARQGPPDENSTIGPRELKRFELPGSRSNPAYQLPEPQIQAPPPPPAEVRVEPAPPSPAADTAPAPAPSVQQERAPAAQASAVPRQPAPSTSQPREARPVADAAPAGGAAPAPAANRAGTAPSYEPPAPDAAGPEAPAVREPAPPSTGFSWSYLLFALLGFLLAIGVMRLLGRRAKAEEPLELVYRAADQHPEPRPAPAPPPRPAPQPQRAPRPDFTDVATGDVVGIQIRPWLQLDFKPDRAAATLTEAAVQYELAISNVGNADARNIRVEARMFNAGAEQDKEIKAFFASPVDDSRSARVLAIPARKGARLRNVVAMPKENVREINVQGRRLFIPLVAFNVVYEWGDGKSGQTSMSYLVGREPDVPSDKMGAFRLDLGPRVYRSVGQRPSQVAVRV